MKKKEYFTPYINKGSNITLSEIFNIIKSIKLKV